jgi:broad specificity phosphatase PhoE
MRNVSYSILLWLALISAGMTGCHNGLMQKEPSWTTFILVRHAEKAGSDRLSGLTLAGKERAERLATHLADAPVKAVYSTDYTRTKATAQPTASNHQLDVQLYMSDQLDSLSQALKVRHKEGVVLLVGHSNTTPALANSLIGEEKFLPIDETDYSQMYIVTCREDQRCTAILFRF